MSESFEKLTQASHRLAEVMYQKTAGQAQSQGESGAGSEEPGDAPEDGNKEDEVIDAEYVDMDKKE